MKKETYHLLESYMHSCMEDSAHDKEHIYRVLYYALDIAKAEETVDYDVLIAACLLHDIGRKEQFENPALCHAQIGAEKTFRFLIEHGFSAEYADRVKAAIRTHRYRKNDPPVSLEAKILFDADKVDVCGAIGMARTLLYKGGIGDPLYSIDPDGAVSDGTNDTSVSFFQEYKRKLEGVYSHFHTKRGAELAKARQHAAVQFYENLLQEAHNVNENGRKNLQSHIE